MKIDLVFWEWKSNVLTNISGSERMLLETDDFHAGSTFKGEIKLDKGQEEDLKHSLEMGYKPLFTVYLRKGVL